MTAQDPAVHDSHIHPAARHAKNSGLIGTRERHALGHQRIEGEVEIDSFHRRVGGQAFDGRPIPHPGKSSHVFEQASSIAPLRNARKDGFRTIASALLTLGFGEAPTLSSLIPDHNRKTDLVRIRHGGKTAP